MRTPLIILNAAVFVLLVGASCLVDGKASDFECSQDSDCTGFTEQRICDLGVGYCVKPNCPSECNGGCNVITRSCLVNCPGPGCSGGVDCPSGFDCTITCNSSGACSSIDCKDAASCMITCGPSNSCGDIDCGTGQTSCTIACGSGNACDNINCGDGACTVNCTGTNGCGNIDCKDSCSCLASCGTNSCGTVSCPTGCAGGTGCMNAGACTTCP